MMKHIENMFISIMNLRHGINKLPGRLEDI